MAKASSIGPASDGPVTVSPDAPQTIQRTQPVIVDGVTVGTVTVTITVSFPPGVTPVIRATATVTQPGGPG